MSWERWRERGERWEGDGAESSAACSRRLIGPAYVRGSIPTVIYCRPLLGMPQLTHSPMMVEVPNCQAPIGMEPAVQVAKTVALRWKAVLYCRHSVTTFSSSDTDPCLAGCLKLHFLCLRLLSCRFSLDLDSPWIRVQLEVSCWVFVPG